MTTLLKDDREILELILASGKKLCRCRDGHIKHIEVYEEPGQSTYVPWFAVYAFGGYIIARVNAAHVEEVRYG
jgi:hypothetical protein